MSNHTEECSGCIAEYQGKCVVEICYGKLIQFPGSPINRPDSRERHKKAYEIAVDGFKQYFADDYRDEDTEE